MVLVPLYHANARLYRQHTHTHTSFHAALAWMSYVANTAFLVERRCSQFARRLTRVFMAKAVYSRLLVGAALFAPASEMLIDFSSLHHIKLSERESARERRAHLQYCIAFAKSFTYRDRFDDPIVVAVRIDSCVPKRTFVSPKVHLLLISAVCCSWGTNGYEIWRQQTMDFRICTLMDAFEFDCALLIAKIGKPHGRPVWPVIPTGQSGLACVIRVWVDFIIWNFLKWLANG